MTPRQRIIWHASQIKTDIQAMDAEKLPVTGRELYDFWVISRCGQQLWSFDTLSAIDQDGWAALAAHINKKYGAVIGEKH